MPAIPMGLQFAITSLLQAAKKIEDPAYRAGLIFDFCPDEYKAQLYEQVMQPDALERFFAFDGRFAPYRQWCAKVLEALRKEFTDDGGADDEEPTAAGA